jgi:hypothetical protein
MGATDVGNPIPSSRGRIFLMFDNCPKCGKLRYPKDSMPGQLHSLVRLRQFLTTVSDCAERDSLVGEFEKALDQYIHAAREMDATTDGSDLAALLVRLQSSRKKLLEHCEQHGCKPLPLGALA